MIEEEEVLDFIRNKLSISIVRTTEFGPVERIGVILMLDGEIIDEDYVDLDVDGI